MTTDHHNFDSGIERELEARIVAWVAGEASPFEVAELERLAGERPEVAVFKRRIEAVHALVGTAARPPEPRLRLSAEKRASLLAKLRQTETQPIGENTTSPAKSLGAKRRAWWASAGAVAAAAVVGVCLPALLFTQSNRSSIEPTASMVRKEAGEGESAEKVQAEREMYAAERRKRSADVRASQVASSAAAEPPLAAAGASNAAPASEEMIELSPFTVAPAPRRQLGLKSSVATRKPSAAAPTASIPPKPSPDRRTGLGIRLDSVMGDVGSASASSESPVKAPVNSINFGAGSPSGDLAPALSAEDHAHEAVAAEQLKESWGLNLPEPAPPALADAPLPPLAKTAVPTQGETDASKEPVSTFSLHVSDVSYRLAVAEVLAGRAPDPARIRQEEFYNAFDYGDPAPTLGEKVACRIEQSAHPYLQQRNLVRVALKVPAAGRGAGQPLQLTLLLDTSGSMEREDRAGAVRRGLEVLASLLGAEDRVNVVGFARESRLIAEQVAGDQLAGLLDTLKELPAEGGTDLEAALKLAGEVALRHFEEAAQNRIILITDGAANLGNARPEELATMVQALRQKRIALDACGVGVDELNDDVLEALTRKSDGRYYLLNSPDTADAAFARQVAGALRPAAEDVKVQVRFNPSRVKSYRLIGFEKHRLAEEDFRNDAVDAAELAADEAAVAMYEIEALPEGQGELGELYVRFRDASNGNMVERAWTLPYDARAEAFDRASPAMLLAGLAAVAADKLKGGAGAADLEEFTDELNRLRSHFADDPRVQEFVTFFERLSDLNP